MSYATNTNVWCILIRLGQLIFLSSHHYLLNTSLLVICNTCTDFSELYFPTGLQNSRTHHLYPYLLPISQSPNIPPHFQTSSNHYCSFRWNFWHAHIKENKHCFVFLHLTYLFHLIEHPPFPWSVLLKMSDILFLGWITFHCECMSHFCNAFVLLWTSKLVLYLNYSECSAKVLYYEHNF